MIDTLSIILILFMHYLLHKGKITLVAISVLASSALEITLTTISEGTILAPVTSNFVMLVIMGAILFNMTGIILTTISSSLIIGILVAAQNAGWMPPPNPSMRGKDWFVFSVTIAITGGLAYHSLRTLRQALNRTNDEIARHKKNQGFRSF
jgi:hypothetical protein